MIMLKLQKLKKKAKKIVDLFSKVLYNINRQEEKINE